MNSDNTDGTDNKPSRRGFLSKVLGVTSVALLGASGVLTYNEWQHNKEIEEKSPKDLEGNPVMFEPGEAPSDAEIQQMDVVDDDSTDQSVTGGGPFGFDYTNGDHSGFWVPAVGLSAPLSTMFMVNNVINPPGFQRVYEIRNLGNSLEQREKGTVYLATHSIRAGTAPGNALISIGSERSSLNNGDLISVRGVEYFVDDHFTVPKSELPKTKKVWEDVPGRLVVVTCLQRAEGGRSLKNSVIFAQLPEEPEPSDGGEG